MCTADENSIIKVTFAVWLELDLYKIYNVPVCNSLCKNTINHNLSANFMLKIDTLDISDPNDGKALATTPTT